MSARVSGPRTASKAGLSARLVDDRAWMAGLFLVAILTRLPFTSKLLYHWDSVNFALGMEHFDTRLHQPHPPGYLLYVLLGRLIKLITGDANAALVTISVLFGGLTAVAVYWLARRLFGKTEAIISGLFVVTSPAFWFYSEVALTYILEAFFVTAITLAALEAARSQPDKKLLPTLLTALLLGLAGGIRQTTLVLMAPLWLFAVWRAPWKARILSALLLGVTVLAWLVPTVLLSGGLAAYIQASQAIGGGVLTNLEVFSAGSLFEPVARLGMYLLYALMLGLAVLAYGIVRFLLQLKSQWRAWLHDDRAWTLGLWLLPSLALYAPLVRAPGHTFSFITALVILTAASAVALGRALSKQSAGRAVSVIAALMLLVNAAFFLAAPPYLFGVHKVITTTTSLATIAYRDIYLRAQLGEIRADFDPSTTAILASGPDFRHPSLYLRDYTLLTGTDNAFGGRIPPGVKTLVLFGEISFADPAGQAVIPLGPAGQILYKSISPGVQVLLADNQVTITP